MSRGFIHALASVPLQQLESMGAMPRTTSSRHSNRSLHFEVSKLHQAEGAVEYLIGLISPIASFAQLSNLDELMKALEEEKKNDYSSTHSAYNRKSAVQFHCLLVALFIAYMKALKDRDEIHKAEGKILKTEMEMAKEKSVNNKGQWAMQGMLKKVKEDTKMMARKLDSQTRIWNYGRILWTVALSRMFDDHLQSLQGALVSVRPGEEAHTWFFKLMELANEGPGDGDAEDDTEDIEEEQRQEITLVTSDANPVTQFKSWTRLIISHFVALRHVTLALRNKPQTFEGKFIVARRCGSPVPLELNWPNIIRNLSKEDGANTTSFGDATTNNPSLQPTSGKDSESRTDATYFTTKQADEAINLLQGRINENRKLHAAFGTSSASSGPSLSSNTVTKKVPIAPGMGVWTGLDHCEAIAVSLFRYPDNAILKDQRDLRKIILVSTIFPFNTFNRLTVV